MTKILAVGAPKLTRGLVACFAGVESVKVTVCSSRQGFARQLRSARFELAVVDWCAVGREGMVKLSHLGVPVVLIIDAKHLVEA